MRSHADQTELFLEATACALQLLLTCYSFAGPQHPCYALVHMTFTIPSESVASHRLISIRPGLLSSVPAFDRCSPSACSWCFFTCHLIEKLNSTIFFNHIGTKGYRVWCIKPQVSSFSYRQLSSWLIDFRSHSNARSCFLMVKTEQHDFF